ncbi:MAG: sigma-70 family RNA polymerase sigma factor [bacterium]
MNSDQNHEAFEKLFLPVQTSLRGYLFATTRDWTATDELFQEVATTLWRKFDKFDDSRSFRAWALGMARLQVLKRRQAFARSRLVFSEELMDALATVAGNETKDEDWRLPHLAACMEKLPPNDRELMAMRFEQDLSLAEIGRKIHKSVEAAGMSMMRIRRWLRDCMVKTMAMEKAGVQ